ncbi:MAG: sensor histidine kinase [Bacteroidota bacterium]
MDQTNELSLPLFIILWGILCMLLLALAIIIFFVIYQKRLFAQQEHIQQMNIDHQKKLLQYSFEAQESERKRIASDLHDEIGSTLSAIRIYVHQLNHQLQAKRYEDLKSDTTQMIDQAIHQIRGISHNLFPPNLEHLGLLQASRDFCQRIQKLNAIQIDFTHDLHIKLPQKQELTLYRILQELVTNSLKHSQANTITLHLQQADNQISMVYQDDGKGFDLKHQRQSSNGLGMKNIESRAHAIGANIAFQSGVQEGFQFRLVLEHPSQEEVAEGTAPST